MMSISRKNFIQGALTATAAVAAAASPLNIFAKENNKKGSSTKLNLSFGEGTAPGETLEERLDYMEKNGITGLEPGGGGLSKRINEFNQALNGRNIKISAICAGFQGFILAKDDATRKLFHDTYTDILAAAGELGSVGVIMVPAFLWDKNQMEHTPDTRKYLVETLQGLGEIAEKHNTSVILEPLNRAETFYLRQVSDAAQICKDVNSKGVKCMGDFWHMSKEEPSDYAAFMSGRDYLAHVHIASKGNRIMPGEDGEADTYIDGFRALKEMNYPNYVSFECGCKGDKAESVAAALKLIREQWEKA